MVCKSIAIGCLMSWYHMYIYGRSHGQCWLGVFHAFQLVAFHVVVKWELTVIGRGRVSGKQTNVFLFHFWILRQSKFVHQGWRRHWATILRTPLHKGVRRRIWTSSSKSWWKIVSVKVLLSLVFIFVRQMLLLTVTVELFRSSAVVSHKDARVLSKRRALALGRSHQARRDRAHINLPQCLHLRFEEEARCDRHADLRKLLRNNNEFCGVSTIDHFVPCRETEWWRELSDLVGLPETRFAFQFRTSVSMSDDGSVFVTLPDITKSSCAVWTCHVLVVASDKSHAQRIYNMMLPQLLLCAVIEYQMDLHSCSKPVSTD